MTTFFGKTNNATSAVADVAGINGTSDPVTFNVTTGEGTLFPASNFKITIDNEIMLCTSRTGDALTCTRASEGTTIAAHTQNADVEHRITAATLTEYETLSKMQGMDYAADAGSTDTYAVTLAPAPTAYFTGMVVKFKANTLNTGAATLNVNALGAKDIKKNYNTALETGDILANQLVSVIYDGTNFQMLSPSAALSTSATDGWTDHTAYTWTYASASTFTIAGVDLTTTFTKGTRLKFTQTTVKYAVVVSSSFSTNTTVTIAVNTDYTIANAAISANYYSYQANPQGYPGIFNWTPTYLNVTPGNGTVRAKFSVVGTQVLSIIVLTFGSTSSMAGPDSGVGFPITPNSFYSAGNLNFCPVGGVLITDTGTEKYSGSIYIDNSTSWAIFQVRNSSTTYLTHSGISSTVPMTWATGDILSTQITYFM